MTNSFADFDQAKMLFVIGSNTTEAHPVAATFIKQAAMKGAQLIVCDPRKSGIAEHANLHVPLKVGSDVAFLNALMNVLIAEDLYDKDYVKSCTVGFEDLKNTVARYTPEMASEITGLSPEMIRDVARRLASVKPAMLVYTLGITEQIIFPEIDLDKIAKIMGLQITFVTTAKSDEEAYALLKEFGIPFKNK